MKDKIPLENLLPVLNDKLHMEFENLKGFQGDICRKQTNAIAVSSEDERTIIAKVSTIDVDRQGDVVIPSGCDYTDFNKNPCILFAHNYSEPPIAKAEEIQITDDAVYLKIKFGSTDRCKEFFTLVKENILNAFSIGFYTRKSIDKNSREFKDYVASKMAGWKGKVDEIKKIITDWTMMEASLVAIPANQNALVQYVSTKSLSEQMLKELNVKKIDPKEPKKPVEVEQTEDTPKETDEGDAEDTPFEDAPKVEEPKEPIVEEKPQVVESVEVAEDKPEEVVEKPYEPVMEDKPKEVVEDKPTEEAPKEEPVEEDDPKKPNKPIVEEPKRYVNIIRLPNDCEAYVKKEVQSAMMEWKVKEARRTGKAIV